MHDLSAAPTPVATARRSEGAVLMGTARFAPPTLATPTTGRQHRPLPGGTVSTYCWRGQLQVEISSLTHAALGPPSDRTVAYVRSGRASNSDASAGTRTASPTKDVGISRTSGAALRPTPGSPRSRWEGAGSTPAMLTGGGHDTAAALPQYRPQSPSGRRAARRRAGTKNDVNFAPGRMTKM